MKKLLLIAISAAAVSGVSAEVVSTVGLTNQQAVAQKTSQVFAEDAIAAQPALSVVPMRPVTVADAVQPVEVVQNAEGDTETETTPVAFYRLPDGAFYNSWLIYEEDMNWDKWGYTNSRYPYVTFLPANTELSWTNRSTYIGADPSTIDMSWAYSTLEIGDDGASVVSNTSKEFNLVTPAYAPYYAGYPSPKLTFNENTYPADDFVVYGGGNMRWNFTNSGFAHYGLSNFNQKNTCAQADLSTNPIGFWMGNYSNWTLGNQIMYTDCKLHGIALEIAKPSGDAVLGLKSVTFVGWVDAALTGNLKVDVYEKVFTENPDNPGYGAFSYGERLGGGFLVGSDVTPSTATQFLTIPMLEVDGSYSQQSFVNVDRDVYVVFSVDAEDYGKVMARPYFMGTNSAWTNYGWYELGVYEKADESDTDYTVYTGENVLKRSSESSWQIGGGARVVGFAMFYDGAYTTLDCTSESNGTLEYVAPAEGGSKTFTFDPYYDLLESGKFTGEGVNEWLLVYPEDIDETTETQDVVVEVDPLPAGVVGRASVVTVAQPGSQVQITVRQGDTSGIDSINGDAADVVSSQIFDLQGRQLNAVPESGLYIRRDVKADNTVSTVKVVK